MKVVQCSRAQSCNIKRILHLFTELKGSSVIENLNDKQKKYRLQMEDTNRLIC